MSEWSNVSKTKQERNEVIHTPMATRKLPPEQQSLFSLEDHNENVSNARNHWENRKTNWLMLGSFTTFKILPEIPSWVEDTKYNAMRTIKIAIITPARAPPFSDTSVIPKRRSIQLEGIGVHCSRVFPTLTGWSSRVISFSQHSSFSSSLNWLDRTFHAFKNLWVVCVCVLKVVRTILQTYTPLFEVEIVSEIVTVIVTVPLPLETWSALPSPPP